MNIELDGIEPIQGLFSGSLTDTLTNRPLTPTEETTQTVATQILNNMSRTSNLDPAGEMIKAGIAFEQKATEDLKRMEEKSNEFIESIDILLDLSRELSSLNAENPKLTQTAKDLVQKLKDRGINLIHLEEGKEIDKEQLSALKTTIGSHIDKSRTQLQQIFTKMQTIVQNMSSVNDSIKKMISEQSDLIRKAIERSTKR
jgi:hypothetical protein